MKPPPLRYVRPATVEHAVSLIDGESRPLAGGQSLIPLLNLRQRHVGRLVDVTAIPELQRLELDGDTLVIGAGVALSRVESDPAARHYAGVLVEALRFVASPQVRVRGTVGGNLAHGDPVSEVATSLVALRAMATVRGPAGMRRANVEGLELSDAELLVDVRIDVAGPPLRGAVHEVAARYAARALVVIAAVARLDESGALQHVRVAVGGVSPRPVALDGLEVLCGLEPGDPAVVTVIAPAIAALSAAADPRADETYRRDVAAELAVRALRGIETAPRPQPSLDRGPTPTTPQLQPQRPHLRERDAADEIALTVNGEPLRVRADPRLLLSDLIRGRLGLHATHVGCEQGVCGSCNVLIDGIAMRSCLMLACQADGREIQTLEGLRDTPEMAEIIDGFVSGHGLQCGFCTPGFMVTLADLRRRGVAITSEHLVGNICRCTGYAPIMGVIAGLS